jgi:hypothetical protein
MNANLSSKNVIANSLDSNQNYLFHVNFNHYNEQYVFYDKTNSYFSSLHSDIIKINLISYCFK